MNARTAQAGAGAALPGLAAQGAAGRVARNSLLGVGLVLVATGCFATLDTATKVSSVAVPVFMALWARYAFQALALTALLLPRRGRALLRTRHPGFQALRGALLVSSSLFAFLSLRVMPVGEFTAIVLLAPLAVTLLAATVLKEQVSRLRWCLVAGGFAGVLVIMRPGGDAFTWAALLPLGLVSTNAAFQVLTSRLARTEDPLTMHFYTGWVGALLPALALPWTWAPLPHWGWWTLLAFMGLMGTIGHYLLILGYQRAPASTLTPFLYAQVGFAMLLGWIMFDHVPDTLGFVGIAMIASCGAFGAWLTVRERHEPVQPAES